MKKHVLVVDDDEEIRDLTCRYLDDQGFQTSMAASCAECERALGDKGPDIVLLDVMLPDRSGLDLCRALRDRNVETPIILVTALREDVDRIIGLEIGADDYVVKPFVPRELAARINAVLRRTLPKAPEEDDVIYSFGIFSVEPKSRSVSTQAGRELDLTGAEFDLLVAFLERPGRLLSRELLLQLTAGQQRDPFNRSIDVLVSRLRKKLSLETNTTIFKTVRNGGYQMTVPVTAERPNL